MQSTVGKHFEPLRLGSALAMLLGLAIVAFPLERIALYRARR